LKILNVDYKLIGTVNKIIYFNNQSNWGVLSVKDYNLENLSNKQNNFDKYFITVAGNFNGVYEDSKIEIYGNFKSHIRYGDQIEIVSYKLITDNKDKNSIINFLTRSNIKGINIQNAKKIYNKYKDKSIDIVINNYNELLSIKGIGKKTIEKIKNSAIEYKEMEKLICYCTELGFSYSVINKIYKVLGNTAIDKIKENIYCIIDYVEGISFKQVDLIALNNGIKEDNIERIKYCFLYTLKLLVTFEGSTGCKFSILKDKVLKELGITDIDTFICTLNKLEKEGKIYLENNIVYLKYFYDLEKNIASYIKEIANRNNKVDINEELVEFEINNFPFKLNKQQINTIKSCLESEISVITGGAGVGKSTILKALVNIYSKSGYNAITLAPSGKATRRIEECTNRPAYTIHKFLGVKTSIEDTEVTTLPKKSIVFIDESSMLDIIIFNKLLEAFNEDTKLVLLGDCQQLPSVSAGDVLSDLLTYNKINVNILTDTMRQAKDSNIIANCSKVNSGELLNSKEIYDFVYREYASDNPEIDDFTYREYYSQESLIEDFMDLYENELNEHGIGNIQVMTPYKKGIIGVHNINKLVSDKFNNEEMDEKFKYKCNDKVMHIVNNYDLGVFNGEVGTVSWIDEDYLKVKYSTGYITYDILDAQDLILAYCNSIHKSQGSEYPIVFVLLDDTNTLLLYRKILYTALSRGKKKVYLLSMLGATDKAIKNNYYKERLTKLSSFLKKEE
jgi:exodeoxyribonuclease V alpha subunit